MFQFLCSISFLATSLMTSWGQQQQQTPSNIIDPMANVIPLEVEPPLHEPNNREVRVDQRDADHVEHPTLKLASAANKRYADDSQLVIQTQLQQTSNEARSTQANDLVAEECAYTFIVPREAAQTPVCSNTKQRYLTDLSEDVLATKLQVEEIRNEINEEKRRLSNSDIITTMQEKISHLEKESTNMDQRVSQLYMQMLHEIINKRDNTIELQNLEKKLLNQTIHYYQLLESHENLKRNHSALQKQVNSQSNDLNDIRQQLKQLSTQVESCQCGDELLRADMPTQPALCPDTSEIEDLQPPKTNFPPGPFLDCTEVQKAGYITSGTFNLKVPGYEKKIRVWCDLEQDPGGWTVIQRRSGRRVKFSRKMEAYKRGFGRPHSDHWLGLENLYQLTNQTGINYKLHIELEDWDGSKKIAEYGSFRVTDERTGYQMKIAHYSGNAGDSMTWHNNMAFSTVDSDNDVSESHCAATQHGGWWYRDCARSNLNGVYYRGGHYLSRNQDGIYWTTWRGTIYSLKNVVMKIRPLE